MVDPEYQGGGGMSKSICKKILTLILFSVLNLFTVGVQFLISRETKIFQVWGGGGGGGGGGVGGVVSKFFQEGPNIPTGAYSNCFPEGVWSGPSAPRPLDSLMLHSTSIQ